MFRRSDGIAKWRVHDDNALGRCIRDIDIVDTNAGTANDFQVRRGVQNLFRHLCRRTDGKAIIIANHRGKFIGRFVGDDIDITAAFSENLGGVGIHFVGNKYAWFGHYFILLRHRPSEGWGLSRLSMAHERHDGRQPG